MVTRDWLNPSAAGGDIVTCEHARYLARQGHEVTLLVSSFAGGAKKETVDGVDIVRLGPILTLWLFNFIYYMRRCRGRYDIVVEEGFGGSRIPRFAPLYVREEILTEWYQPHRDLFASQYPKVIRPLLNLLERLTAYLHRDTFVRALTGDVKDSFVRLGFRAENIFVLPVGIREDWLTHAKATQAKEPRIVWLGKFRRYKCPHHVLLAMRTILNADPSATLVLAGRHDDRRYERRLHHMVERLGIKQSVEFRFNISEDEKRSLLNSARVLVLPSSVEGFGIVVLEANASGVPVVASSGVPEGAVRDGYNGLRYPFGDVATLADTLIKVLSRDDLHSELSLNGVSFARGHGWETLGRKYEQILQSRVNGRKPD